MSSREMESFWPDHFDYFAWDNSSIDAIFSSNMWESLKILCVTLAVTVEVERSFPVLDRSAFGSVIACQQIY